MARSKLDGRTSRRRRIRKKVFGTEDRLRLSVFRSLNNIYAQIIDDGKGVTLVAASSVSNTIKEQSQHKGNVNTAKEVGTLLAKLALEKGIKRVVFDRGGYLYHGRVKALADSAREAGLEF